MTDAFLSNLAQQLNSQFSIGENANHTLDSVIDGKTIKMGALGDLAPKIDQSATRSYAEEGYLRLTPYQANPKQIEVLLQEPNATLLVKKRMFSSLAENHRPDFMDVDEKLFFQSTKILFQNKCRQIAALEKLSKIQRVTSAVGNISEQLFPVISTLTDTLSQSNAGGTDIAGFGTLSSNTHVSSFVKVVDRIRKLYGFNTTNQTTTWISDHTNLFQSTFGQGTGVIEITNFNSFNTTVGLGLNSGNFQVSIMDPYEAMRITEFDIERALSDATNAFYNHKSFQFGKETVGQIIVDLQNRLNQYRSGRGASPLTFKIDPDTLLGKRVTVIIDRIGTELIFSGGGLFSEAQVAPEYLRGGAVAGQDGLDTVRKSFNFSDSSRTFRGPDSELGIFQRLITSIFDKLSLDFNSRNAIVANNENTNYARRKLRFNFLGKLIIQPMDVVHFYVNSKSRYDNKLLSGLQNMFTGVGILQNLNNTVVNTRNAIDTLGTMFGGSGGVNLQAEKTAFVGPDFPNFLWSLLRGQFVTEKEGTHTFAGIVDGATRNWSDGKWQIDIRGSDNTAYFKLGKVNFKPSVDVFNGSLFDPLTPFKTKFDTVGSVAKSDAHDLLDENVQLLGTTQDNDSTLVKFKLGPSAGRRAASDNLLQDHNVDKITGRVGKIYHAPDGLVYKWKEGIGTLVMFGSSQNMEDPNLLGTPAITNEPFAGQDVMNVLSLLITGQPYNFATYWKTVVSWDSGARDPQSGQDAAYSFYAALRGDLAKNNALWGNFIPFKNLMMDEQTYALTQAQLNIIRNNKDLELKIQRLADLKKTELMLAPASSFIQSQAESFKASAQDIQGQIKSLTSEVDRLVAAEQEDRKKFAGLVQFGSDTSFDFSEFIDSSKASKQASNPGLRRLLRRQLNYLTRRMSYSVRGNEDKNLFIVDDSYDKDYDILAFETSLDNGIKLYNNEFTNIQEKIANAAGLLDLEVFCDTQGHIRVRSPQYNRVPSSVFYRMMYLKQTTGVQVFPQFLDDLFSNQIKGLIQRVEILEDQIRLDCAVIGINNDKDATAFILSNGANQGDGSTFGFLSDEDGGISHLNDLVKYAAPELEGTALGQQAVSTKDVFNTTQRVNAILTALGVRSAKKLTQAGYGIADDDSIKNFNNNTYIDILINRIRDASGQEIQRTSFIDPGSTASGNTATPGKEVIDAFKVIQELADKIRDRQHALKVLYGALKNSAEFRSLDNDKSIGNSLLTPGVLGNAHIPEVFEHMIEDETYDDYGPGSGSRYIIKNAQIRNISISENPPDYTMVSVQGKLDPIISNSSLPSDLNVFPSGGNGLVTGAAIDYDTWRNYGFRELNPITVPFLNDPNTQCAPYAAMILSRARRNIIRGSVTISGNEFMQPGEVIFLENDAMLFYVSSVRHSFTFSSGFTTSLELTYGHTPGEYIPTPLDVIGKMIYNGRDFNDFIIQRQSSAFNEAGLGVILKDKRNTSNDVFSPNDLVSDGDVNQQINTYSAFNSQTINNILYTAAYRINSNNSKGNTVKASVELRVYFDDKHNINNEVVNFAEKVKSILTTPDSGPKQLYKSSTGVSTNPHLNPHDVEVVRVNLDDKNDSKSPSQKAFDAARNNLANISISDKGDPQPGSNELIQSNNFASTIPTQPKDKLRIALFNYVVDCWIKFDQVPSEQANSV